MTIPDETAALPSNVEVERAVLGAVMYNNALYETVGGRLSAP